MEYISAPRGTQDILPPHSALWAAFESLLRRLAANFGYEEIRLPIFEYSELFQRGVGIETDIVAKEMYTFQDKGGRSLTLRPEGTAGVARAYLQHQLANRGLPVKLFYLGPMFRYERPQAGRYRQHHQFGFEVIGGEEPELDVETITLAVSIYMELGISQFEVLLNSIGCKTCRPLFLKALEKALQPELKGLCTDCQRRFSHNPLRILDCKNTTCAAILDQAPLPTDHLCAECQVHFQKVKELLRELNLSFRIESKLVRGLDYYTRTVFEIISPELGAQNSLCGGGRYDNLIEALGGPPTPSVGFAGGMERALLIMQEKGKKPDLKEPSFFIVHIGEIARLKAMALALEIRRKGIAVDLLYQNRSLSSQLKTANRKKARYAIILGEEELAKGINLLKNLKTGQQEKIPCSELLARLKSIPYD